jgi:hypothetical protein
LLWFYGPVAGRPKVQQSPLEVKELQHPKDLLARRDAGILPQNQGG